MKPKKKGKKKNQISNGVCCLVANMALCVAAVITIPKILPYVSGAIYKQSIKASKTKKTNEDWGPVIEKKN